MAQALPVYAVAALLLVASAGPITRGVRDASLGDFEDLDNPRPLDSFPFLKQVRPYLPPVVVEWLIVKQSLNLPDGGDFRVDDDGRIVVVWPDGCEETHASYLEGSVCDADPCNDPEPDPALCGDPCLLPEDDPARPDDCDPDVPPLECESGTIAGRNDTTDEPECIPDPKCDLSQDDPNRPDGCPDAEPPTPPVPPCPAGQPRDYKGNCIAIEPKLLSAFSVTSRSISTELPIEELTLPFANMSLIVEWEGFPVPTFSVTLVDGDDPDRTPLCWTRDGAGSNEVCTVESPGPLNTENRRTYTDAVSGPIPAGNYTLIIDYEHPQTGNAGLHLRVHGKPFDAAASD